MNHLFFNNILYFIWITLTLGYVQSSVYKQLWVDENEWKEKENVLLGEKLNECRELRFVNVICSGEK